MGFLPSGPELWVLFLFLVGLYPLPTYIALRRRKRNVAAILVLNLALGWTFIGWLGVLVWALTVDQPAPRA